MMPRPTPVILDTDIGTDPDDLLALLMVASSPELDLQAITTTYGDTMLRAQIAEQSCRWIDVQPAIATGPTATISEQSVWYAGNERQQLAEPSVADLKYPDAVELILDLSERYAGTLGLIAIGPLTNIAHAVESDPTLPSRVRTLSVMGGDFADPTAAEHNLASDAEAARTVFEAGFNALVIGVEQTRRLRLSSVETQAWTAGPPTPIKDRLESDLTWWRAFHRTDEILVHDPLAVAMVSHPHLFATEQRSATVQTNGAKAGRIGSSSESPVNVVTDFAVDELRALIIDRIRTTVAAAAQQDQRP